ncbi:MAG: Unknown protein [uncultured Sulfurovum sp.]|uniref:Uncharacterized protein n=1 Tax=uncultured Sulfurovum sp. TaxID=269237 RepID=A0A6S6SPW3_9BACT|nr:MAG: Unknown protein [uncultured Sulfurovum sp.]
MLKHSMGLMQELKLASKIMTNRFSYILIPILLLLTGCKMASNLLESTIYPKSHNYAKGSKLLNTCNFNEVAELLDSNKNNFLKNSEKGLLSYYQNESKGSNDYFDIAIETYRNNENKALFDVSTFLTKEYQGEGYDKVFLHNYKAINYLMLGNAESARVEARNSNISQQEARLKLDKLKSKEKNSTNNYLLSRYDKLFNSVDAKHNPYQNPFAYYISALSYAEDKDYGNAVIDIRKALKFSPNSKILKEKLKLYSKKKRIDSVELFFDIGQSPLKSQVQLEMKLGNGEKRMVSLPTFSLSQSLIDYIEIVDSKGAFVAKTSLLNDINAIKINEFKEKLPAMLSIISGELALSTASEALNNSQSKLLAGILKAGMAIYSQNDIATWSLLPQKILVASFQVTKNENYKMIIHTKDGRELGEYPLTLGKNSSTNNIYKHFFLKEEKICY